MTSELLIALIGVLSTALGSYTSFLFTRKKYHTEVDNNVIENMQKSLEFYTKLSDDNKARLEEALKRNDTLEDEVRDLRNQMFKLLNNICYDLTCSARQKLPRNIIPDSNREIPKECVESEDKA